MQGLREALEMEDPDLIIDLHGQNKGYSDKFAVFWEKEVCISTSHLLCMSIGMVRSHTWQSHISQRSDSGSNHCHLNSGYVSSSVQRILV